MGDENPIRTLGDYSEPSHEGYRNTIELPDRNNVVPLRTDTIWLVQNGCSFHGLRSEDPNQHLKDFLKLVDSLEFDVANRERTRLRLFQFSLRDQASNWLECIPAGSISTWEDLTTHFLAQFFPPGRTVKLISSTRSYPTNDPQSSSNSLDLVNAIKTCSKEINHSQKDQLQTNIGIGTQQSEEPEKTLEDEFKDLHLNLPVLEVLAHASLYNAILDKYIESLELGKNRSTFIQGEMPKKIEDLGLFTLPCRLGDWEPFDTLADLVSCVNIIPLYLFKRLKIRLLKETNHGFGLADGTKSYPVGIVRDIEVHIGKLKFLNDFYVIDIEKVPATLLLVERGFLATTNAEILDWHLPGEWEIARDAELNPFKDVLVFRRMDNPPNNGDGAWHAKIRLIDPDGEEFTKTFQSIPTSRKVSKKENPREIIDLDHFHDT
ncbi:MAK10-like protein [Tanacetum coccineum]